MGKKLLSKNYLFDHMFMHTIAVLWHYTDVFSMLELGAAQGCPIQLISGSLIIFFSFVAWSYILEARMSAYVSLFL